MANKTTYERSPIGPTSLTICSTIVYNPYMNAIEIGILVYLFSKPDSYIVNKNNVRDHFELGAIRFNRAWENLMEAGYIIKVPHQGGVHWHINDIGVD